MKRQLITISGSLALVLLLTAQVFAKELTVRGRLQRTVEAGGWVINAGNQKYLILNPQRFQNEKWFTEANEVEAVGETKSGVVTIYMEGTPFEVRTMRPLAESGSGENQNESRGLTKVLVTGDSIVQAQPDTAILTVSVVTQGRRALDAQQENATRSDAVVVTGAPQIDTKPQPSDAGERDLDTATTGRQTDRRVNVAVIGVAVVIAAAVFLLFDDAVIGIAVGAGCYAIANRILKARTGHTDRHYSHR